jgi:hypothetical protein
VLVAEGKLQDAGGYADRIRKIGSQNPDTSFDNRMSLAEYLAATGHKADAVQQIRTLPLDEKQHGRNFEELEAELLLLKLQSDNHDSPASRTQTLSAIRKRAERAGFKLLISRTAHDRV